MALQKQIFRMAAQGGLDTKTDEKNVLATNFLELENVVFRKIGAFTKRFGYLPFTRDILNSATPITSGKAASVFKDELLRYTENNLYSYLESENKWINRGKTNVVQNSELPIATNGDRLLRPSHDTYANLTCYVYERQASLTQNVEYRLIDNITGAVVYTGTIVSGRNPTVYNLQGKFFIVYKFATTVQFRTVNFSTPSQISAATSVISVSNFATERIGGRIYVVGSETANTGFNIAFIKPDSTVSSPVAVTDAKTYFNYSVSAESGTNVRVVYGISNGPNDLKTVLFSRDLNSTLHAPVTLSTTAQVYNVAAVQDPTFINKSQIYACVATAPYKIVKYVVTETGAIESTTTPFYMSTLVSKPKAYNGRVFFALCKDASYLYSEPFAPFRTYFLGSEDGSIVAKYINDAGGYPASNALSSLNVEGEKLTFTGVEAAEVQKNTKVSSIEVPTTIKRYSSDFSEVINFFDSRLGENLHVSGGILKMYDGEKLVEHGFLEIPRAPRLNPTTPTGTGGTLPIGQTFQWVAVYAWKDRSGQTHRSAPSLPFSWTVTDSGLGPHKPNIQVFSTPFTDKEYVEIEVYRTTGNGTTFYKRAHNFTDRINNDKSVETYQFGDTMDDATLIGSSAAETLYTTGGVLENVAPESSKYVAGFKNRLFLILSDGRTLQFSKRRESLGPVEFSDFFKKTLDEEGGAATCLGLLDDTLIIFKERAIFYMTGDGPNNLGQQDDFREPALITTDCGCTEPNSVVMTPDGLMFKGEKGIYILKRGLTVQYVGAPVEAYNTSVITSATLVPDTNEVRFTTNTDKLLMYDYLQNKWATFTNINAIDAVIFRNKYTFLRANGDLLAETKGLYSDNGSYIAIKIVSSWLQLAEIQGFGRFYKMLILGAFKSAHSLRVKFAYNFNPSFIHETIVTAGALLSKPAYGDSTTYGSDTPYGGEFPLYQFEILPKQQKCESFKFCIEDFKTIADGESMTLSNFAAEIGIKPSTAKNLNGRSFGTK